MKTPKTKQEFNQAVREQLARGSVPDGQFTDADMNKWLRSRGEYVPEPPAKPVKQLTPEQAVEVLEAMSKSGMTFAQAKEKVLEAEARAAAESGSINKRIRAALGRTVESDSEGDN